MAEIALIASIVQIADTGYRLSLKLYTSGEAISSADRAIITISKDISLTSTVLKELGEILGRDQDEKERICSENLVQTAGNTVKECLNVFEELDTMILKNMPNLSQGHKATGAKMALERLKWPFIQPRIQLLRGSLDMLRANISLMLNVLIYARHVSERSKSRAPAPDVYDEASHKTLIEELKNSKDEYVRKLESLKLFSHATENMPNMGSRAAPTHTEGNVGPTQHSFNPLARAFHPLPRPTSENAPAPQWPLPNIPASYPIVSKNPVTIQSDEYSVWAYLRHFDTLMASLIREIYSPEYQIPRESRSRFTGAIRETHTLEVVEAKRRGSTRSGSVGRLKAGSESYARPLPPSRLSTLRRSEPQCNPEILSLDILSSADKADAFVTADSGSANKKQGQKDQSMADKKPRFDLVLSESTRKADRNDVVDDLVRLWTLVR